MFSEQKQWLFEYVKNHQAAHLCYLTLALNILKKKKHFSTASHKFPSIKFHLYLCYFIYLVVFILTYISKSTHFE